MRFDVTVVVYPDGERQEIEHPLRIDQLVDLNGIPLRFPLPTPKLIAYRVYAKHTRKQRNEDVTEYHLELVPARELLAYCR
jgi:hypothetical protein